MWSESRTASVVAVSQPGFFFPFSNLIEEIQVVFVSPKPPTEKSEDVFLFHVYFRKLLGGVSSSCITPLAIALPQRRALFIFSRARKLRRA